MPIIRISAPEGILVPPEEAVRLSFDDLERWLLFCGATRSVCQPGEFINLTPLHLQLPPGKKFMHNTWLKTEDANPPERATVYIEPRVPTPYPVYAVEIPQRQSHYSVGVPGRNKEDADILYEFLRHKPDGSSSVQGALGNAAMVQTPSMVSPRI